MSRLVVMSGLPGTGKTTLGKALARAEDFVYLRVDAVETPLFEAGIDVGLLGYQIVHELARSNLELGLPVVVDLVNPWPQTRAMWRGLSESLGVPLSVFECVIPDEREHRRRVESRVADLPGHEVPTWDDGVNRDYVAWDEERDGPRVVVDMTDMQEALAGAREALKN